MLVERAAKVIAFTLIIVISGLVGAIHFAQANPVTTLNQTINPGTLTTDFMDNGEVSTTSAVSFSALPFSASCQQTSTSTIGTATQMIWVRNMGAANNGWTLTIGAATSSLWHNTASSSKYDWNDAGGSGCTDGDADTFGGQMFINPTPATVATATVNTVMTGVTKGPNASFTSSASNLTLLQGAANSSDVGKWTAYGFDVSQKVPADQTGDVYTFDMTISIVAN
jgi:hypothetical protein